MGNSSSQIARPACEAWQALEGRDDDALMQLTLSGYRRAFELLIRRHQPALRAYCARICGSGAGDEIVQEVFITVWNQRHAYEPRGTFRKYIFTIADRRSRNVVRGRGPGSTRSEREQEPDERTPLEELIAKQRQGRLEAALAKLPSAQRAAILLHYAAGLEYEEIAEIAKRPASTIRARVFSGIARLRRLTKGGGEL